MFKWALVIALSLSVVAKVSKIGKTETHTAGWAAVTVAETLFWIVGTILWL